MNSARSYINIFIVALVTCSWKNLGRMFFSRDQMNLEVYFPAERVFKFRMSIVTSGKNLNTCVVQKNLVFFGNRSFSPHQIKMKELIGISGIAVLLIKVRLWPTIPATWLIDTCGTARLYTLEFRNSILGGPWIGGLELMRDSFTVIAREY